MSLYSLLQVITTTHHDLLWFTILGLLLVAAVVALQKRSVRRLPPGDIIHLRNYSQHIIVLNSEEAIRALFVRRAELYSDRPQTSMYSDLVGRNRTIFNSNIGPRYRRYVKMLHQALSRKAVTEYRGALEDATVKMVRSMMESPDRFLDHFRTCAGRISLKVAYGHEIGDEEDYYVQLVRDSIALGNEAFKPGRWLVDSFPLPDEMTKTPLEKVKEQMAAGTAIASYASRNLAMSPKDDIVKAVEHNDTVVWTAAAMYVGTADTTVAALSTFALLMVRNPDVQRKAQAEIDSVLGGVRLPCVDDRGSLPYVEAVMKECMRGSIARYNTVGPLALAHSLRRTDEYAGYTLPKGATVYANFWALTRDPSNYPSPHTFRPERFVPDEQGKTQRDPWEITFGMGLRRCPGWQLADAMLFLAIVRMLATFDFMPETDEHGCEVLPAEEWTPGPNCGAKPFKCRITPRSRDVATLLDDA
ncbi:cytochrome P450 [Auriculariales sp. MPI-PUGE-AT-0066]|nr:cytochrome P450 [Auriculariales sp. MPI-PUGE-AT-0066]